MQKAVFIICYFLFTAVHSVLAQMPASADSSIYTRFYYENKSLSSEGPIHNGKPDGYWKTYYENGKIKSEGNRKNFVLDSTWKFYNDLGNLVLEYQYSGGKKNGYRKNYDAKSSYCLSQENYVNDVKQGQNNFFYKSGQVKQLIPFKEGREEGTGYEYDSIGTVISIIEYRAGFVKRQEKINRRDAQGLMQGVWKEFYANGALKNECTYVNDFRNGYLKEYAPNGNLLNTTKYIGGKVIENAPELAKLDT